MPLPTPFHPRTSELCTSLRWKDWAGYHAVCSFDVCHEKEYYAFRHAAGVIDVTPLFKYDITGPDAAAFLTRMMTRNITKLKPGRVTYCCWCDEAGKVLDDGTVWHLGDGHYRATAAEPNLYWFHRNARGFDVSIEDTTDRIAALSIQGPTSREVLKQLCDADLDGLRFFGITPTTIDGFDATITRTGYTGDLGYEVWVSSDKAVPLWDALMAAGRNYGLEPAGLDAYDVCRVEAGFIMNGVDYYSANHCLIESRKSTPDEAGLGWTVTLDREPFNGQAAIRAERERGPALDFVGLEIDWNEYEAVFAKCGLPPEVPYGAWRTPIPVYADGGRQVGRATSGAWSALLKKNLALATVEIAYAAIDQSLRIEVTAEYERHQVLATVRQRPFFDPPRKRE